MSRDNDSTAQRVKQGSLFEPALPAAPPPASSAALQGSLCQSSATYPPILHNSLPDRDARHALHRQHRDRALVSFVAIIREADMLWVEGMAERIENTLALTRVWVVKEVGNGAARPLIATGSQTKYVD
ncbi:hypothetical protein C8R44DRAFT_865206 [Mycena epipterygia]|nr:hypothetical protein C8R44DRAFT_865206 [Mycena epipterygia]